MDEMKINSKFLRNLIAKFVKKVVKKKAGYEVDIQLNEFTATITDGTVHVHLNADVGLGKEELTKLLAAIGL